MELAVFTLPVCGLEHCTDYEACSSSVDIHFTICLPHCESPGMS